MERFLPQRPKYACLHSKLFGLILFTSVILSENHLTKGCTSKDYKIQLTNVTGSPSDETLAIALKKAMPVELCNSSLSLDDPSNSKLANLTLYVKNNKGFQIFEDLLLKGFKSDSGNTTLLPYSRVFVGKLNVSNPNVNHLEQAVQNTLGGDPVVVTDLSNGSVSKVLRLWLDMNGSFYPTKSLNTLIDTVNTGDIEGIQVDKGSFKAYMVYPGYESKDFEIQFNYPLLNCKESLNNSEQYNTTHKTILTLLNDTFSGIKGFKSIDVTSLKCASTVLLSSASARVRASALLKIHKPSKYGPQEVGNALSCSATGSKLSNIHTSLLTPESFDDLTDHEMSSCPITTTIKPTETKSTSSLPSKEPSTAPPSTGKTPRVFVRLRLAYTWSQFCRKLEDSLKHNIAKNVYDKKGNMVSPNRIVFINTHKNCADPLKENEPADLWFYVSQRSGTEKPSRCVTLKAQRVLRMMVNNGNTKMLGSDFAGKVITAGLAGCDAHQYSTKQNDMDYWMIVIIVAIIIGAILLLLACCCICCGAALRRRRHRKSSEDKQMELVIVNDAYSSENAQNNNKANSVLGMEGHELNKEKRKNRGNGRKNGHAGGRSRPITYSDYDSDEYYDCGTGCLGATETRPKKTKKKRKEKNADKREVSKQDEGKPSKDINNDINNINTEKQGTVDNSYDDVKTDKLDVHGSTQENLSEPASVAYQNLAYGLGDRKPSNGSDYATVDGNDYASIIKRPSTTGSEQYVEMMPRKGSPALSGTPTGLRAGSITAENIKSASQTPAIVTSPAPTENVATGNHADGNVTPTLSDRRGSAAKSGSPNSNRRPSSATSLSNAVDDEQLRERRRSSIHHLEDDAEPLKHKTATVGIVGLALRNKNERKKETEFKNLDKEMPTLGTYPASTAGKNRFPEILPNPRSRVKISSSPDYINASYLHDHKGQRHYIATQHPLVETMDDFWQMVWDKDSRLIVMVNDDENSKQIDYPSYLPTTESETREYNDIVTNLSNPREIIHYRYTSWKNKDQMPNVAMFVGFVVATREIGKKYEDGKSPVIVHCSDGQGFSGVFIALDIGIRSHEESKTSVVDLFELAKRLRQGRSGIISSLQLYNFTYQCLYEYTVNYDEEAEKKKE